MKARYISLFALSAPLLVACTHEPLSTAFEIPPRKEGDILMPKPYVTPKAGDGGVVVAESASIGMALDNVVDGEIRDCEAGGLAVNVSTVNGDQDYLFDKDGNPCEKADVIFDGLTPAGKRAPSLGIKIDFEDVAGKRVVVEEKPPLPVLVSPLPQPELPEDFAISPNARGELGMIIPSSEPVSQTIADGFSVSDQPAPSTSGEVDAFLARLQHPSSTSAVQTPEGEVLIQWNAPPMPRQKLDPLADKVRTWRQQTEYNAILRDAEKLLADMRGLGRLDANQLIRAHQNKILELQARLRESERNNQWESSRQERLALQMNQVRKHFESERIAQEQKEREMRAELERLGQTSSEYKLKARELEIEKQRAEQEYQARAEKLAMELKQAEQQSDFARQQMVYEAARKIAEAEALAKQARLAKKHALERQASRLQFEAADIVSRAEAINAGQEIVVPAFSEINWPKFSPIEEHKETASKAAQKDVVNGQLVRSSSPDVMENSVGKDMPLLPLEGLSVSVRAEDVTLDKLFGQVFDSLEDRAGFWEVVWSLDAEHQNIPQDKWTVVAETNFEEFLSYVAHKIKETHGIDVKFTRFDHNHLFVISN